MCSGLEDFQLLRKYSEKHHTNLQKKHTGVARDMQLQERSLVRERSKEERAAECKKQPQNISFHHNFGHKNFTGTAFEEKKILNKNAAQEKPPHCPPPFKLNKALLKKHPSRQDVCSGWSWGAPFSRWALPGWSSSHVTEANNQHRTGAVGQIQGRESRTHRTTRSWGSPQAASGLEARRVLCGGVIHGLHFPTSGAVRDKIPD